MGYTHYWIPKKTSNKKFKEFSETCKRMYNNLPNTSETAGGYCSDEKIEIGNSLGELSKDNQPEFSTKIVIFNGVGENAHEGFFIEYNNLDEECCKTNRKPYDFLVCACLIAAADILGYRLESDGNIEDWKPAISFYKNNVKNFEKRSIVVNKGKSYEFTINL